MRRALLGLTIAIAIFGGIIAYGQERVCTPSGCYFVPASPRPMQRSVPQSFEQSVVVESREVVVTQPVRQPLRRVFANQPIRRLFSRLRCR
jgi:hypothetical protein